MLLLVVVAIIAGHVSARGVETSDTAVGVSNFPIPASAVLLVGGVAVLIVTLKKRRKA